MKHRITMKAYPAAEPELRDGIKFCWHVHRGEEFLYCGRDWLTTLEVAREKAGG